MPEHGFLGNVAGKISICHVDKKIKNLRNR